MFEDNRPVVPVADFDRPLPDGINIRGRGARLWAEATKLGENGKPMILMSATDMVLLEEVCRHLDYIDGMDRSMEARLRKAGDDASLYVAGLQGTLAADPLLSARRSASLALGNLIKQLALPDPTAQPTGGAMTQREHQANAAKARWGKRPAVGS